MDGWKARKRDNEHNMFIKCLFLTLAKKAARTKRVGDGEQEEERTEEKEIINVERIWEGSDTRCSFQGEEALTFAEHEIHLKSQRSDGKSFFKMFLETSWLLKLESIL